MSSAVLGQSSLMGLVCDSKEREKQGCLAGVGDHPEQQTRPGYGCALCAVAVAVAAGAFQSPSGC